MISRTQIILLQLSIGLTTLTGVAFAAMKYAMKSDDPFAVVNHPMQPFALAAHVVVAPLAVFAFGWITSNHIVPGLMNRDAPKRASGFWSVGLTLPMVLSGYLMQVTTADTTRQAMTIAHWVASGFFVIAYAIHFVTRKKNGLSVRPED